jgi:DNA polymerase sigma
VPDAVVQNRAAVVARTQGALRRAFGPQLEVRAFGSTQYGVSRAGSDLDLVVIVRPCVFSGPTGG